MITASPLVLLTVYCLAIAAFSLLGGMLPNRVEMTHTRTQLAMSLVSGLMLGVAFYHLIPHSVVLFGGEHAIDVTVWWSMLGLVLMLLMLRLFHFHQHDFSPQEGGFHSHDRHGQTQAQTLSWVGIGVGLSVHTLIDGIALGAMVLGAGQIHGEHAGLAGLAGLGVFLAVLLHKPLDALSITSVMAAAGWSSRSRNVANLLFALMCPIGATLFVIGVNLLEGVREYAVAAALAFSAGTFICIALGDLLPEVQFHSHDRFKLSLVFLLGVGLAYAIVGLEPPDFHG